MIRWRRTTACESAWQWISLELDDELSELESAALQRHLEACASCSAARAELAAFTLLLRSDLPVAPRRPVVVPTRPRAEVARRTAVSLLLAGMLGSLALLVALPQASPAEQSAALRFATDRQQAEFAAAEHARIDAPGPGGTVGANPSPFASRVLD